MTESELESVCKCCGEKWTITSCNFHDLCTACFNIFDNIKMCSRFGAIEPGNLSNHNINLESSDAWVKSGLCKHTYEFNMMAEFYKEILISLK